MLIVGERSKRNTAYGKSDGTILIIPSFSLRLSTWEGSRHTPTTVMLCVKTIGYVDNQKFTS